MERRNADPRSPTGSITPGPFGPASATAPARIADPAIRDLQGTGRGTEGSAGSVARGGPSPGRALRDSTSPIRERFARVTPSRLALQRRMRRALVAAGDRLIEIDHCAGHQPRLGA